jgi:hypothetical protein
MPPTTEEKLAQAEEMLERTLRTGTSMLQQGAKAAAAVAAVDADDQDVEPKQATDQQLTPGMKQLCSMGIRLRAGNMEAGPSCLGDSTFINTSAMIAAAGSATPPVSSLDGSTFVQHSIDESVAVIKHAKIEAGAGASENSVVGGADDSTKEETEEDEAKSNIRQAVVHAANARLWSLLSYQLDRFWSQRQPGGKPASGDAKMECSTSIVTEFEHTDVISALVDAAKQLSSNEVKLTREKKCAGKDTSEASMSIGGTSMGSMVNEREMVMENMRCMDDSDSCTIDSINIINDINPFKKEKEYSEGKPQGGMSGKVQVQVRLNHLLRVLSVLVELASSSTGRKRIIENGGIELVASSLRVRAQQYKESVKAAVPASSSPATASPAIVSKLLGLAALMAKQGDAEALLGSSGALTAIVDVTKAFVALELETCEKEGDAHTTAESAVESATAARQFVALMAEATSALKFLSFDGQNQTLLVECAAEALLLQIKEEYTTTVAAAIEDVSEAEKMKTDCLQIQRSTDAILRRLRRLGGRGRAGPAGGPKGNIIGNVISIKTTDDGAFKDKTNNSNRGGQENAPHQLIAPLQKKQQPKAQHSQAKRVASSMRLSLLKYGRI